MDNDELERELKDFPMQDRTKTKMKQKTRKKFKDTGKNQKPLKEYCK